MSTKSVLNETFESAELYSGEADLYQKEESPDYFLIILLSIAFLLFSIGYYFLKREKRRMAENARRRAVEAAYLPPRTIVQARVDPFEITSYPTQQTSPTLSTPPPSYDKVFPDPESPPPYSVSILVSPKPENSITEH